MSNENKSIDGEAPRNHDDAAAAAAKAARLDKQAKAIHVEGALERVNALPDSTHRAAVLANLADGQYHRQQDIDADIEDLERRVEK
jgi:hypothetical protein